ncbi:hypothetical protein RZS08_42225, partial [Arthrospira platensis SPKY1]|nr:hypothetical protein [Arthrospira platensis SPKY1]
LVGGDGVGQAVGGGQGAVGGGLAQVDESLAAPAVLQRGEVGLAGLGDLEALHVAAGDEDEVALAGEAMGGDAGGAGGQGGGVGIGDVAGEAGGDVGLGQRAAQDLGVGVLGGQEEG